MSNSINPLFSGLSTIFMENNFALPLSKLPPELSEAIKNGATGQIEILPTSNQLLNAILHINGESFAFSLPQDFSFGGGREVFDVRISSNGQMFPLQDKAEISNPNPTLSPQNTVPKVEMQPLKLSETIASSLQKMGVDAGIIKQITQEIAPLNVSLSAIGKTIETKEVLQPLQNILSQFANQPDVQSIPQLKSKLEEAISLTIGKKIGGEIATKVNDLTMVKTDLGNTFFSSKINLPPQEKVILTITSQASGLKQELKFLDNLLAIISPKHNVTIKPEVISAYPQLKNLMSLSKIDLPVFDSVINKLPFTGNMLLENIYDFYQAAVTKDIKQWLNPKMAQIDSLSLEAKKIVMEELNSFIGSSIKETPSWRIVEMPMFDGTNFKPLKIAVRKDRQEQKEEKKHSSDVTRFIVETGFSKLGEFQFDGLSEPKKRKFDLIIRTSQKMSNDFCANIINLFKKSLYNLDYTGTIKINSEEAFIKIRDDNTIKQGIYI